MTAKLGILGVGHLASYVVAGLRNAGDGREIVLSPRNRQRGQILVSEQGCERASSNQEVLNRTKLVLLSVRPHQLEELLMPLDFTKEHLVISCVAGVSFERLQTLVGEAKVVRTLPLACAEVGQGAVPLFPAQSQAQALLEQLGQLIVLDTEEQFELASVAACMNGWMFRFFDELADWYADQGLERDKARELVLHACSGAAALASSKPEQTLKHLSDSIATEGTYTKLGLDLLEMQQAFNPWIDACSNVEKALKA